MTGVVCLFGLLQVCLTQLLLFHISVSASSHKYERKANTTLGHMLKHKLADSAVRCCAACSREQWCHGVSFTPESGRCELNWWADGIIPVLYNTTGVHVYSNKCPVPWVLFNGHCYLFSMTERNWTDSRDYCNGLGSELVDIQSDAETTFVRNMAIELAVQVLWIGIGDVWGPGTWSNGQSITFTDFDSGEPNNLGGNQDCVAISSAHGYRWDDRQCDRLSVCSCKTVLL